MRKEKQISKKSEQIYAELLCDFMFKKLFGSPENKDMLIEFLNTVLEDYEIIDVTFIPTIKQGLSEEDRKVIFDIACTCADGETIIIEMQRGYQKHFLKRALYYTTYPINEQATMARDVFYKEKAEIGDKSKFNWDYNLKPVIVVAILNFSFKHDQEWPEDKARSSYRLREDSNHEIMTDTLRFVFMELNRFKKRIGELETMSDMWMYLFKHIHEMVEIPKEFDNPFWRRLFFLAEIHNFTAEEKIAYQKSLENMGDYDNILNTAIEEAEIRGEKRGLEKGIEEGIERVAMNMKSSGISAETIVEVTGLPLEKIQVLGSHSEQ
jgi:hypothetical protein